MLHISMGPPLAARFAVEYTSRNSKWLESPEKGWMTGCLNLKGKGVSLIAVERGLHDSPLHSAAMPSTSVGVIILSAGRFVALLDPLSLDGARAASVTFLRWSLVSLEVSQRSFHAT